jgi:SAM-dependent methyltransferase
VRGLSGSASDSLATAEFDAYAYSYSQALERGLRLSGEDSSFFARERVKLLGHRLTELGVRATTVLDFGCGVGSTTRFLLDLPGSPKLIGTDVSQELLKRAREEHGSDNAEFVPLSQVPEFQVDVAYTNGVFHHIPPPERPEAVSQVWRTLRLGGLFGLWENNPWNPGTRMVMRRIPFDRDAKTLSALQAVRLLRSGGFEIIRVDFRFIFPRVLRALRPLEPKLMRLPLGAQYMVLARKPRGARTPT